MRRRSARGGSRLGRRRRQRQSFPRLQARHARRERRSRPSPHRSGGPRGSLGARASLSLQARTAGRPRAKGRSGPQWRPPILSCSSAPDSDLVQVGQARDQPSQPRNETGSKEPPRAQLRERPQLPATGGRRQPQGNAIFATSSGNVAATSDPPVFLCPSPEGAERQRATPANHLLRVLHALILAPTLGGIFWRFFVQFCRQTVLWRSS